MTTIARQVTFLYPSDHQGVVTLRYDDTAPLAVDLDFGMYDNGQNALWTAARDVLADGLTYRAGEGAIQCWIEDGSYHVRFSGISALTGLSMEGTVRLDEDAVREFLVDTEDLVPYGAESVDFDVELAKLLIGGP